MKEFCVMTNEVFLTREEIEHPYANLAVMLEDKRRKAEQMSKTVFARITASPEVLAEKLVYCNVTVKELPDIVELTTGWYSTIIPKKVWSNEEEAIAATAEKLKEVCDE